MSFPFFLIVAAITLSVSSPVSASEPAAKKNQIVIPFSDNQLVDHTVSPYMCGDRKVIVDYWNAGDVSLAGLNLGDSYIVAANVVSASGAKYAGDRFIWWADGNEATFVDLTKSPDETSGVNCVPAN